MIARTARPAVSLALLLAAFCLGGCTNFFEIQVETPIKPKLDVTPFQRVLVAGFVGGGTEDIDTNMETVRLLRSQLRTRSKMRVIEADVLPLAEIVARQIREGGADGANGSQEAQLPERIRDEKDLEAYDQIFANVDYWKQLGEEHQNPLIVTGSILFVPHQRSGFVQREEEVFDALGRRSVRPVRTYRERKGYILRPKFIFIDGRTGTQVYSETFREEVLYDAQQNTPALSSYFELMDRVIPGFLGTLSSQSIRGTRFLLK
ncbi:MAG: hypothetical protein ACE148_06485 [Vicinamibacterales bacterium]